MAAAVSMTVFFIDGTKASFRYPRQSGDDASSVLANVKKAIDADKIVLEVDGNLLVVPMRNIKYIQVSPAPPHLPSGTFRDVRVSA